MHAAIIASGNQTQRRTTSLIEEFEADMERG